MSLAPHPAAMAFVSRVRRRFRTFTLALTVTAGATLAATGAGPAPVDQATPATNTLTAKEKTEGWRLLFDGRTTDAWRGFNRTEFPTAGWTVADGSLKHMTVPAAQTANAGDIVTKDEYGDFDFQIDWKITPGGNSGIKYLVNEALVKTGHAGVGFEMQVLDDERHPDAKAGKNGNRTAGALYDLIPPTAHTARPVGEWNHVEIISKAGVVQQWLNGTKVVEFELGSARLKTFIAESKFKDIAGFGEARRGRILLQDHGDEVWFRNIKIKG
ncbi:MAG: DUF1080 domain-containing protein [Vicinamibacterales bacterium]